MDKNLMIEKTKDFVKEKLYGEGSGHDWFHIERVYNLSKFIAEKENADLFIVRSISGVKFIFHKVRNTKRMGDPHI